MKAPGQISSSFKKAQCSAISEPKGCIGPRTAILTIACANSSLSWKVIEWSGGNSAHSLWKVQIYQVKQYRAASAWQSWSSIANCQVMARIVSSCCLMQGVLHPPGVAQFRTGLREEWLRPSLMKSFFFLKGDILPSRWTSHTFIRQPTDRLLHGRWLCLPHCWMCCVFLWCY